MKNNVRIEIIGIDCEPNEKEVLLNEVKLRKQLNKNADTSTGKNDGRLEVQQACKSDGDALNHNNDHNCSTTASNKGPYLSKNKIKIIGKRFYRWEKNIPQELVDNLVMRHCRSLLSCAVDDGILFFTDSMSDVLMLIPIETVLDQEISPLYAMSYSSPKITQLSVPTITTPKQAALEIPPKQLPKQCSAGTQIRFAEMMKLNKPRCADPESNPITLDEVAEHNTKNDCWVAINGKVYDITSYLAFHPGGIDILKQAFGRECTALVNQYHPWVNVSRILKDLCLGKLDHG